MNEELATVNSGLRDKVDELDRANNDIVNLPDGIDIAAVLLDTELKVRRFTAATQKLLKLRATDIGRPLSELSLRFTGGHLLSEAQSVIDDLAPLEKEVESQDGRSYLRRILPYRTQDDRIEGVVVTFIDITERVHSEAESRRLAQVVRDSNDAVTIQDFDGRITEWNRGAERMYGYRRSGATSMNIREIVPEERRGEALELIERVRQGKAVESQEVQRVTRDGRVLDVWLTVTPLEDGAGATIGVATTERDITERKAAENERTRLLDTTELRFRVLAENVPALFSYVDASEHYVFVNKRYERVFDRPAHDIVGKTVREHLGSEGYEAARPHVADVLAGRETSYESAFGIEGSKRWMHVHYVPDFDDSGVVNGFFTLVTDRTREKEALRSLQESRDRYAAVLDHAAEAIVTIDKTGTIDAFNPAAERMFGYSADEAIGENVTILMPEPYRSEHDSYIERYLETGEARVIGVGREDTGQRKDGSTFPIELAVSEIDHGHRFTGIIRDITERKKADEALKLSRGELRALSARLLSAEESERRRISRELHDDVNQRLAMLSVDLETLSQQRSADIDAAKLRKLRTHVAQLSDDVHTMAYRLHPAILDDLGLLAALRALVDDFCERHDIEVSVRDRHFPRGLSMDYASCLYRVVQESLTNIAKHSDSRRVDIRLAGTEQGLRLSIRDYGVGFDVQAARNHHRSLGIVSMEERVRLVGGELVIWSLPRRGTRIRVTIPLVDTGETAE